MKLDFVVEDVEKEFGEGVTVLGGGEGGDARFDVVPWLMLVISIPSEKVREKKGILTGRFGTFGTGKEHIPDLEPLLQLMRLLVLLAVLPLESRPLDCVDALLLGRISQFACVAFLLVF